MFDYIKTSSHKRDTAKKLKRMKDIVRIFFKGQQTFTGCCVHEYSCVSTYMFGLIYTSYSSKDDKDFHKSVLEIVCCKACSAAT